MKSSALATLVLAALALFASSARAGTVIKCAVQALDPSAVPGEVTMYLEPDRARIEFRNDDVHQAVIYTRDNGQPRLWFLDEYQWTYRELKKNDLGKARGQAADELETIEEQLSKYPKEEREATRAQMRHGLDRLEDIVRPKRPEQITYEKGTEAHEVLSWMCERYSSYYEGDLHFSYDVARWEDLGITYDDVRILVELREDFGDIAAELAWVTLWTTEASGFPVQMESYVDGVLIDVTRMRGLDRSTVDPQLFARPKDYDVNSFFSGRGGAGSGFYSVVGGAGTSAEAAVQRANAACQKPIHNTE
jgi:hypothetical protein